MSEKYLAPPNENLEEERKTQTPPQKKSKTNLHSPECPPDRLELDILVVGQAGSGKSSTGNSLLLRRVFATSNSSSYGNLNIQSAWTDYRADNGELYRIKVTDLASPEDIDPAIEPNENKACENIAKLVTECPRGFHVIVITVRLGVSFTDEYTIFEKQFPRYCLQKHGVVVITGADGLIDDDLDDEKRASCFKDWCDRQTGNLKRCFEMCKGRIVLFDNKTKDHSFREEQLERFLSVVKELAREKRYTDGLFHTIAQVHEKQMKQPTVNEKVRGYISVIQGKFSIYLNANFMKRVEEIEGDLNSLLKLMDDEGANPEGRSTDLDEDYGQEKTTELANVSSLKERETNESANAICGKLGISIKRLQSLLGKLKCEQVRSTAQVKEDANQCINEMVKIAALPQDPELYVALVVQVRNEINEGLFCRLTDCSVGKICCIL